MADAAKKKKIAIISIATLIVVAMVIAVVVGVTVAKKKPEGGGAKASKPGKASTSKKAIEALCQPTTYKETCESSLSQAGDTTDLKELIRKGFEVSINRLNEAVGNSSTLNDLAKDPKTKQALDICKNMLDTAIEDLSGSFEKMGEFDVSKVDQYLEDVKVWLSAAVNHQTTCIDAFEDKGGEAAEKMKSFLKASQEMTSNGLAMVGQISNLLGSFNLDGGATQRRLLGAKGGEGKKRVYKPLPAWMSGRKLDLLTANAQTLKPNVVVAQDGSGQVKTINEALKQAPKKSATPFVIYIKAGLYKEYVIVDKEMQNVVMIGDGPTKTRITGNKNKADGVDTMNSATFAAVGDFFVAKDIGFENTAGSIKHQAVALRVQSDFSIFYNCHMDAFQDTLYTQTYRQFYRDCTISGTVDFIFGDAVALFQNCKMIVRKPGDNQACMVTAQGRSDKNEISGITLQNCTISGEKDYLAVKDKNKAYLGRPWKAYARTVIMQSQIDDMITPEGYMKWEGSAADKNNHMTGFFGEYNNRGPGADMSKRAPWPTIKKLDTNQAGGFTGGKWLEGDRWIKPSGVPFVSGMIAV